MRERALKRFDSRVVCLAFLISLFFSLYVSAMLVHGNLNETNVLVVPRYLIDISVSFDSKEYEADTAVLIDFGQTVDSKHPDAVELLRRDVQNVRQFFVKQGIRTPSVEDTLQFITSGTTSPSEFINESSG
jgi:serine/threonine-protein kinase RIO1